MYISALQFKNGCILLQRKRFFDREQALRSQKHKSWDDEEGDFHQNFAKILGMAIMSAWLYSILS